MADSMILRPTPNLLANFSLRCLLPHPDERSLIAWLTKFPSEKTIDWYWELHVEKYHRPT